MRKKAENGAKIAALILAAAVTVAGCGGSSANHASAPYASEEAAYEYDGDYEEAAAEEVGTADYGYYDEGEEVAEASGAYADIPVEAAEPEMEKSADVSASNAGGDGSQTESADSGAAASSDDTAAKKKAEEKLVYTCSLTMQTLTYEETVRNIRGKIKEAGGIIENEEETNSDSYWFEAGHRRTQGRMRLFITVRIPTPKYESFLHSLEGEGKIMNRNSSVENISRRYRDTQAIIRNLEIQEERLQAMMDKAETIEDMIAVEDRLTEVQTELDQRRTQLASMDTDVALSTVNLSVEEVVQYTPEPEKKDTFADRLKNAVKGSASNFLQLLENILFAAIYLIPVIAVFLVLFLMIRAVWRAYRRKHPKAPKPPKAPKAPRRSLTGRGGQAPSAEPSSVQPSSSESSSVQSSSAEPSANAEPSITESSPEAAELFKQ